MAFIGEGILGSEPRVLVIGGLREQWQSRNLRVEEKLGNGVEAWAYAFNGDYCGHDSATPAMIENYDLVICNTNGVYERKYVRQYLPLAQNRPPRVKWVSLLEGNMTDYMTPSITVRELFDASDVVNCINRFLTDALQTLTTSSVRYIGIPYPVNAVKRFRKPVDERQRRTYICPYLLSRWTDYAVAKQLGAPYYGYEERLLRKWRTMKSNYSRFGTILNKDQRIENAAKIYNDPKLHIYPVTHVSRYYEQNADAALWISMDNRYTWARYVLDAAALGIPIITAPNTGHGEILFPKTTVANAFDIQQAVSVGKQLLNDRELYQSVIDYADSNLELYQPERIKNMLLQELG